MARARDNAGPASSRVQRISDGGAGSSRAGGGSATLVLLQQQQAASMQKLIETMQKAQVENQKAVELAGQAGGAAATKVANQVASGLERVNKEKTRKEDRAEDRQFAEDQQRLNAKLNSDVAKEAAAMGAAIQGQRDALLNFRDRWLAKRDQFTQAADAYHSRTMRMLQAQKFSSPEGLKQLQKRSDHYTMLKITGASHYDDKHLAALYQIHNEGTRALLRGEDAMDLSRLRVEPIMLPMPEVKGKGGRLASPSEIDPDKAFELKMYGGYPKDGVVFNTEENFGLPEGYSPNMLGNDAGIVMEIAAHDDFLRGARDQSIRQELMRKNANIIVESRDKLEAHYDMYTKFNLMFNPMAVGAVQRSIENFLAEDNPHKFDDIGRNLTFGAIKEIFGGGTKGEEVAVLAAEMFDGKREPASVEELAIVSMLESALFNIKTKFNSEFQNAAGTDSFASILVKQMEEELGVDGAARALGVPNDAVGFVQATQVMQGRLSEATAFANTAHMGMEKMSILEQFSSDLSKFSRLADVYATRMLNEGTDSQERVRALMGEQEALDQGEEAVEALAPNELGGALAKTNKFNLQPQMTNMDGLLAIVDGLGPDQRNAMAAFITGELDPFGTSDLSAYLDQTKIERESSGYSRAMIGRSGFNHARHGRARARREKDNPREGPPSTGESFEKGGVAAVLTEQAPALISLAGQTTIGAVEHVGVGLTQMAVGQGAATQTLKGFKRIGGAVERGMARVISPQSNLTDEERQQTLGTPGTSGSSGF